ncbi:MAG: porin family protein [Bacteroidota bacterium]
MNQLLITSMLFGAILTTQGQSQMKFSVHADPQFAWFSSDEEEVTPDGSIFHIQTGIQMDLFFDKNYAFTLGFGINNMGGNLLYSDSTKFISKEDTIFATPGQTVKHNLQYFDIPFGLKLKTEELGYATFFLEIGFNPMININASATTKDDSFDKENIREDTHLFNLGYHTGIGVEYRLGGSTSAIGGVRWTSGLTDVSSNDKAKITMNAISFHLGILF